MQWNAVAPNKNGGSLAHNVGEVLGVFGEVEIPNPVKSAFGYASSARILDLLAVEDQLTNLWSPVWPEDILPKLDKTKIAAGSALFTKYCLQCHPHIDRKDPNRRIVVMDPKNLSCSMSEPTRPCRKISGSGREKLGSSREPGNLPS